MTSRSNTEMQVKVAGYQPSPSKCLLKNSFRASLLLSGFACAVLPTDVFANEDNDTWTLAPISVTAEKRTENVMDVSSSVSVIDGQKIEDAGITSISELAQHVPNLHAFTWGGSRETNIFLRGVGPGLFTDPTVGFYVNGVNYTGNGMFDLNMDDIERVEVLKGPQGTLYGGNSLGGIINIITKKPTNEVEAKATVNVSSLNEQNIEATLSAPLVDDKLFGRFNIKGVHNKGHIKNIYDGSDYGKEHDVFIKAGLRYLGADDLEANLNLDYTYRRDNSYALGAAEFVENNPEKVNHDFEGKDERDAIGFSFSLEKSYNTFDFTSVTGGRYWESFNSADQDGAASSTYVYHSASDETQEQLSQEFRWASNTDDELQWLGGLYGYMSEYNVDSINNLDYTAFGGGGPYVDVADITKKNTGLSAFGQIDYDIRPNITLTAGLRTDYETRKADIVTNSQSTTSYNIQGTKDFMVFLPKLGAAYTFNNKSKLYSSVSQGYRAGGFDHLYPNSIDPSYDEEISTNYELGYKTSLLDNTLELTTALFWIDIKDMQVQQLTSANTIITDNAGSGRSRGLEIEGRYTPQPGWDINFGGSFTESEYVDYEDCNTTSAGFNCNGNETVNTPKVTANIGLQHTRDLTRELGFLGRVDLNYIGGYYFDSINSLKQDPYTLVNAKVGVETDNWDAFLWVKNALNANYSTVEYNFGAGHTAEAADPISVGLQLTARF